MLIINVREGENIDRAPPRVHQAICTSP